MPIYVWVFVILMTACIVIPTLADPQIDKLLDDRDAHSVGSVKTRRKRVAPFAVLTLGIAGFKGAQALRAVLTGAKEIKSNSYWYREYLKKGGFKQAEKDFDKASPTNIREFSYPDGVFARFGEVGDRTIMLKNYDAIGYKPTLEIIKTLKVRIMTQDKFQPGQQLVDKITYTN